ncbi:hypothetical protein [Weizmannia acidilactici]|uniref:hypothetical protein n=1 Tax=Weizmannia acidilactici TaxID=2607726 RepID=UPI00126F94D5|nr:hypothetical protein [Weizmannia acidilactici]GER74427.1 hypothetical protein BpPP18_24940 [Weizmannia acidilactici]
MHENFGDNNVDPCRCCRVRGGEYVLGIQDRSQPVSRFGCGGKRNEKHFGNIREDGSRENVGEAEYGLHRIHRTLAEQARTDFKAAISKGRAYKIAIVGSDAMGIDSNGWGPQLKQALRKAYGSHVHVSLFAYDMNSDEFIREGKYKDVADFQPDLVLFEPFILNNNGAVAMENQLNDIKTAAAAWKDAVLLIQPSFPLYQATNYPDQVDQLEMFTKMEGYTYLNHWKNWPDPNSGKFKAYVKFENGEQTAPSAKGVKVWYEYLRDYFIAD